MSVTFYLGNGTVSGQKILAGIELWNTDSMCSVCVEGAWNEVWMCVVYVYDIKC